MNQLLKHEDEIVAVASQVRYRIDDFIGGGGQGEVYAAEALEEDDPGQQPRVAIKWFFPHYLRQDPDLARRLQRAIDAGSPSDRFLWPLEMVESDERSGFGYVMPLRDERFVGITDLVMRRVEPSLRTLVTAGFELAHNYLQLHSSGLCYRDISFGNLFFDPENGEVRICDNDNVSVDGKAGAIGGTARFMAPEIVRGEAAPSIQSDLFSLSVLLFYMLVNHHPLEGAREAAIRCFDLPAMTRLYGSDPLFIFDPDDDSNRPLPGYHDNALALWPIYPQAIQNLFTRAFGIALQDPQQRVRESEWRSALVKLRDGIFYCGECRAENFYDLDQIRESGQPGECWSCASAHRLPPRMRLDREIILLNFDSVLFPHHLDQSRQFEFDKPVAAVVQHPRSPEIWGLQNHSSQTWVSTDSAGVVHEIAPGQTQTLSSGLRIHFGQREGEIRF